MKFSKATKIDIHRISKLVNSAYRGEYSRKGWTTEADFLDGQRTDPEKLLEILTEHSSIYLALEDEKILGSVYFEKLNNDVFYFGMLTVEPTEQAKGIGHFLLENLEKLAKDSGGKELRLTVIHLRSELISYYERRGFRPTGKIEPFPEDPKFGIPKRELRLLEFSKTI
jgi:ribosomal protein S18 acetylase RimI-like enzyme